MGVENPDLPVAFGVLRKVRQPTYQERLLEQEQKAKEKKASLEEVINSGDTWVVEAR